MTVSRDAAVSNVTCEHRERSSRRRSDRFARAKNSGEFGDLYKSRFPRTNVRGDLTDVDVSTSPPLPLDGHPRGVINAALSFRLCGRRGERKEGRKKEKERETDEAKG